ncbi:MAG: DUF1232 domain-containing protein [Leptolyngbya sp. IPPAS B-1204]|nr:MAG: DUF1232 domain-containing protein [Leptolyngbya sp. IPPAS B-1204]
MLELLQEYLSRQHQSFNLSNTESELFKVYLRQSESSNLTDSMLDLPLLLPQMLQELAKFIKEPDVSPEIRALAGGIYTYVFNPFDFVEDETFSLLGFVDDALVVFYGMELIESISSHIHFTSIHTLDTLNLIKQWENALVEDLIIALKKYPKQLSGIIDSANFEPSN